MVSKFFPLVIPILEPKERERERKKEREREKVNVFEKVRKVNSR